MKFFIDTANLDEIKEAAELSASSMSHDKSEPDSESKKYDISFKDLIREICKIVPDP